MVKGIHHVSMKCGNAEDFQKAKDFYCGLLGLIEIFNNGEGEFGHGAVRHFALADTDVDATVEKVRQAGYQILTEPRDIVISSEPAYPARIAFCVGPLGEEIELFQER